MFLTNPAHAETCESFFAARGVQTFPYMSAERRYPVAQRLSEVYANRDDSAHVYFDQLLTKIHAQREMTFQVKNEITGMYDKFVDVPVNSRAVVLDGQHFDELVQSTAPVLVRLRKLLQDIYSGMPLTAEALGLGELSKENQAMAIEIIKSSIYFEPELIDERMKDYPFLAVSGFDGAIGDPDNPDPRFFEMNLGTPSGLSNNILLLEALLKQDREFRDAVGGNIPKDNTFQVLKETIEDNALAWTGIEEGISVVVSPGIYNGGHADVAAIADLTGMPLVKPEDLYIDEEGYVRLMSSYGGHPIVTGVYGRMEESFFLNSEKIPLISPMNVDTNRQLSRDLGLQTPLRPGAKYEINEKGQPVFERAWSRISENPSGSQAPYDLAEAVKSGRLYYSAIGGRLVDDKRLFPLISDYLVPEKERETVARPVSTLERSEYGQLYENPKEFVVKEPNNSGGVGVYFLMDMSQENIEVLLSKVKASPADYEVQRVREPNTLLDFYYDENGNIQADEVVTDIRIFPMMDSKGKVRAGPNSLLFRTGGRNSFYSNTSKGGGYGIVAVAYGGQEGDEFEYKFGGYELEHPARVAVSEGQTKNFEAFLDELYGVLKILDEDVDVEILQKQLGFLSFKFRDLMDLVPESNRYLAALLRYYSEQPQLNWYNIQEMENRLSHYFWQIYLSQESLDPRLLNITKKFFSAKNQAALDKYRNYGPTNINDIRLPEGAEARFLEKPERYYYMYNDDGSLVERFEIAEILKVENPRIQKLIDEIQSAGGELRVAQEVFTDPSGNKMYSGVLGGFWVNYSIKDSSSYLKPVITYNVLGALSPREEGRRLAVLSHELEHLKFWKEHYEKLLEEGLSDTEARLKAYAYVDSNEVIAENERRAVTKELEVERQEAKRLGLVDLGRPLELGQKYYISRINYPENEALRRYLLDAIKKQASSEERAHSRQRAKEILKSQISFTLELKEKTLAQLKGEGSLISSLVRRFSPHPDLQKWESTSLADLLLFPYAISYLVQQKTLPLYGEIYTELMDELEIRDAFEDSKTFSALLKLGFDRTKSGQGDSGQQQQQQ